MTVEVGNPFPLFLNARGDLLDGGYIYIGDPDENPETSPKACFWDEDLTIAASQPLRTRGGYIVNGAAPGSGLHGWRRLQHSHKRQRRLDGPQCGDDQD